MVGKDIQSPTYKCTVSCPSMHQSRVSKAGQGIVALQGGSLMVTRRPISALPWLQLQATPKPCQVHLFDPLRMLHLLDAWCSEHSS